MLGPTVGGIYQSSHGRVCTTTQPYSKSPTTVVEYSYVLEHVYEINQASPMYRYPSRPRTLGKLVMMCSAEATWSADRLVLRSKSKVSAKPCIAAASRFGVPDNSHHRSMSIQQFVMQAATSTTTQVSKSERPLNPPNALLDM